MLYIFLFPRVAYKPLSYDQSRFLPLSSVTLSTHNWWCKVHAESLVYYRTKLSEYKIPDSHTVDIMITSQYKDRLSKNTSLFWDGPHVFGFMKQRCEFVFTKSEASHVVLDNRSDQYETLTASKIIGICFVHFFNRWLGAKPHWW